MPVKDKLENFDYGKALGTIKGVVTHPYFVCGVAVILVGLAGASPDSAQYAITGDPISHYLCTSGRIYPPL
jgi:hypothetical protein